MCVCVCLLGDVLENDRENGRRMIRIGLGGFLSASNAHDHTSSSAGPCVRYIN